MDARAAAEAFVAATYPGCRAAFLAGSVVRGEATATSDLDLVVIVGADRAPSRESHLAEGWPVEAFLHTPETLRTYFAQGDKDGVIALADELLAPAGGRLFAGYASRGKLPGEPPADDAPAAGA